MKNDDKVKAHCKGHNTVSIGICYIGINKKGVPFRMTHPQHLYLSVCYLKENYFLLIARSIATAIATVAPTIGLLPIPRKPIIST